MPDKFGELFTDLQRQVLERLLIVTAIAATIALILYNFAAGVPPDLALVLWLLIVTGCVAAYALKGLSLRSRAVIYFMTVTFANGLSVIGFGSILFLYLPSLFVFPSLLLFRRSETALLSLLFSLLIILLPGTEGFLTVLLLPLLSIWLTWLMSSLLLNTLLDLLRLTQSYQTYAVSQMEEARTNRGLLAKQAKALAEAKESLEYANHQLVYARQAADEARQLKAQFAANVSHELRTPINLIVGFAEMIVSAPRAYGMPLPAAYWPDMNTIYRNAKHLQSLINDVLDISQIEADQMALVRERIDLGVVLREGIEMLRSEIEKKGLHFHAILPDLLPTLWLDRVRIRQVVINLLGNALRFTDAGSITVQAKIADDAVLIGVIDTGIGIPPEALETVFEEFHQLESSLARRYSGTGLGLTLSRRFVALHHGRLWVESEGVPNKGSSFWVSLPLTDSTSTAFSIPSSTIQADGTRCFIILDDDPAVQRFFERYITKQRVLIAADPAHLKNLLGAQPSALVADMRYADQAELAALSKTLPIILCPMPSGRRVMQTVGVADYLVKPISYENLHRAMSQIAPTFQDVLIVDDDNEIVRLFTRMIQTMGITQSIRKAYSGTESLALMRARRPNIVILDLLMPGIAGLTVLQQMKESPELAEIPVLIVSARGASEAIASASEGLITIQKPSAFQPFELIRCIEGVLETLVS